jgi:hypothetical protein
MELFHRIVSGSSTCNTQQSEISETPTLSLHRLQSWNHPLECASLANHRHHHHHLLLLLLLLLLPLPLALPVLHARSTASSTSLAS